MDTNLNPAEPKQHDFTTTAITVAHQLLQNGKPMEKIPRPKIKHVEYIEDTGLTTQFSSDEHNAGIKALKNGKAIGLVGIFTKEVKQFGPLVKMWRPHLSNYYMAKKKIP